MRTFSLPSRRILAVGLMTGLVFVGLGFSGAMATSAASAHDTIVSSSPETGETVTSGVNQVMLMFSDELTELDGAQTAYVQVTDADGGHHESGCVTLTGSVATTDVALGEAGSYDVAWQVVASDGHQVAGGYSFEWQPDSVTMAAPAFDEAPDCGAEWSGSDQSTDSPVAAAAAEAAQDAAAAAAAALPGAASSALPTSEPEPTMTIVSAAPVEADDDSTLALPVVIAIGVGAIAALSAVVVMVIRRARGDESGRRGR